MSGVNILIGEPSEPCLMIKAIKRGAGSIFISGWGFLMKDKSKLHIRNPYPRLNFPKELTEGESILFGYACREIDEDVERNLLILENVKSIYVQDATGRLWKHNINIEIV
jgi:hypothetical protein